MKYLLIDTTTSFVTVSIILDDKILYFYHRQILTDMSSKIMPIIDQAFKKAKFSINDIDSIFVCNGPGSFTGTRVGVTIAKTIAFSLQKKIIPVSSLELIATSDSYKSNIVSMIDARRGNAFVGIYDKNLDVIKKDALVNLNILINNIDSSYELFSYDNYSDIETLIPNINVLKIIDKHKNDDGINPHNLNPNYLKRTEAEEKLND